MTSDQLVDPHTQTDRSDGRTDPADVPTAGATAATATAAASGLAVGGVTPPAESATASPLGATFVGRRYVGLVLVLGMLTAIGPLTIDTYLPALPQLADDFSATTAQVHLTLTATMLGVGLGQLLVGPLSDSIGRRKPLMFGLAAHVLISVACALAPTITALIVFRGLQGLAGAAVSVVVMATVRDLFSGLRAATLLSRLMLVMGLAPILAPTIGGALLVGTSWRGIFVFLAVMGTLLLVLGITRLPETLPTERRLPARPAASFQAYLGLFRDPFYLIMVLVAGMLFATIFSYVSGSPFVLQELYGLTPQTFAVVFGINSLGMILATQLNPRLVASFGPERVLTAGLIGALTSAVALLLVALTSAGGLIGLLIPLWFMIACCGIAFPNAPTIALGRHGRTAGTAAALLGSMQFGVAALVSPLVGVFADGTPVPMAAIMVGTLGVATVAMIVGRARFGGERMVMQPTPEPETASDALLR